MIMTYYFFINEIWYLLKYHIIQNCVFFKPPDDLRKADITSPNDQIWLLDDFIFLVGSIIKCNSFLHSLKQIHTFYFFFPLAELNSEKHLKKWHNSTLVVLRWIMSYMQLWCCKILVGIQAIHKSTHTPLHRHTMFPQDLYLQKCSHCCYWICCLKFCLILWF